MFRLSTSFLALGLLLTGGAAAEKLVLTQCGVDKLRVDAVEVSSLPVKAGTPLTLSVQFTPQEEIAGGQVIVNAKLLGMALTPYKVDLCTGAKLQCPLKAGVPAAATVTYNIPAFAPTSTVEAHITAVDTQDTPLACVNTQVQLVNPKRGNPNLRYM